MTEGKMWDKVHCINFSVIFNRRLRQYIVNEIKNPDPGSNFEKIAHWVTWVPSGALIFLLLALGYRGLIFEKKGKIVCRAFYQRRHEDELHMFSVKIENCQPRCGLATKALLFLLKQAKDEGFRMVRLGAGRNKAMIGILEKIAKRVNHSVVPSSGWICF